jgi:Domain of unknown function (DUF6894)
MQTFFFNMKDGVPMRDRVGIDFKNDLEAIEHCKELAQHFRDGSLLDDQDLEISVVNSEIHREFVHRDWRPVQFAAPLAFSVRVCYLMIVARGCDQGGPRGSGMIRSLIDVEETVVGPFAAGTKPKWKWPSPTPNRLIQRAI